MSSLKILYSAKQPKSYQRVLIRYNQGRKWQYGANWKFNLGRHWNIITPVFRCTRCNGQVELGLGNHFIEFGW